MPLYELRTSDGMYLLTVAATDDDGLETDLIMFASAALARADGNSYVEKRPEYWKVIYKRYKGKESFLIVKRKEEQ